MLAAVAHDSRLELLFALRTRERHVSELALAVGLSQSCTTRHVQVLERAGVVRARRAGRRVMIGLASDPAVAGLVQWLAADGAPARTTAPVAPPRAPRAGRPVPPEKELTPAPPPVSVTPPAVAAEPEPQRPRAGDLDDFLL